LCELSRALIRGSAAKVRTLELVRRPRSAVGQMSLLLGFLLAVFLVVAPFAVWQLGELGVWVALTAAVCCLLPGCLLFVLLDCGLSASLMLPLVLVGMAARVGCCLLGVGVMQWVWEAPLEPCLFVTAAFYCVALGCETWLMMDSVSVPTCPKSQPSLAPLPSGEGISGESSMPDAGLSADSTEVG